MVYNGLSPSIYPFEPDADAFVDALEIEVLLAVFYLC